jgi:hypothetical protein
MIVTLFPW